MSLAKHVKAVISHIMIFAIDAGAVEENPTKGIAPLTERRAKTKHKKARSLAKKDLFDLLAKLDVDEEAQRRDLPDLVRFFIATGERSGEALDARWKDFDPKGKKLRMSGNIIQARGKGTVRNDGKSETSARDIPSGLVRADAPGAPGQARHRGSGQADLHQHEGRLPQRLQRDQSGVGAVPHASRVRVGDLSHAPQDFRDPAR